MKRRYIPTILFCIFTICQVSGQNEFPGLGHMPSPQAADLGQYGETPVSYYTGRADISVPIYSFTQKNVTLDINLSYDTSGLLINKLPGWVGPGWTLNAGGVITRVQQNYCDEMTLIGNDAYLNFHNYFQAHQNITNNDGTLNTANFVSLGVNYNDYCPDKFYFNFMGFTGHFFLGCDGYWRVSSESNLVVEFDYTDDSNFINPPFLTFPQHPTIQHPKAIRGFSIYDDDGNQYVFGGDNTSIEYSINLFRTTSSEETEPWVATAWYLTQVKDRNGETLYSFSYEKGKFLVQLYRNHHTNNGYPYTGTLTLPIYPKSISIADETTLHLYMNSPYAAGTAARNLYPCMYNFSGTALPLFTAQDQYTKAFYYLEANLPDSLDYNVLPTPQPNDPLASMDICFLDRLTIKWNMQQDSITYQLAYSDEGRRHLVALSCITPDGIHNRYSFRYNAYSSITEDYLTDQCDYWGYYNEPYHPKTDSIKPYVPFILEDPEGGDFGNSGFNDPIPIDSLRKPNLAYSKKGMLHEIIYPTGGKTVLDYELNDFSIIQVHGEQTTQTQQGTAGGLRIKTITEYDDSTGLGKLHERHFSYRNPNTGISSGQLIDNEGLKTSPTINFTYSPIIPLGSTFGTHIGYSFVTENISDSISHLYHYKNMTASNEIPSTGIQPAQLEFDPYDIWSGDFNPTFMRGKILYESIHNSAGTIMMEKTYRYRTDYNTYMNQFSFAFNNQYCINDGHSHSSSYYAYKLYYPKYDLARTTQSTVYDGNIVTDTTYITMATVDTIMQDWNTVPMFRKCALERTVRNSFSTSKAYSYSPQARYFMPLTSTTQSINDIPVRTDRTDYALFNQKAQPLRETTQIGSGPVDTLVTYHTYTDYGHPATFTRKGEYMTTVFWSLKPERLRAMVTSPYTDLTLTPQFPQNPAPENVVTKNGISIFCFPNVQAKTYIYDAAGRVIGSATGKGQRLFYSYDSMNRLTEIRDTNNKVLQRHTYNYSTSSEQ